MTNSFKEYEKRIEIYREFSGNLYHMFCVDVRNMIKLKGALYHHYRMQPSEIENMEYWEYELTLEDLQENLKERRDQEKRSSEDYQKNMPNMNKMTRGMGNYKTPKMPSFKMPK